MPTSDVLIRESFRRVYGQMLDDSPLPQEWDELSAPPIQPAGGRRQPGAWVAASGAGIIVLVAIGGIAWLVGRHAPPPGAVPETGSPTTTVAAPVARMTVVFRAGDLTAGEWDAFTTVLGNYNSAGGYTSVDEATSMKQASDLFADDPDALAVMALYPGIASSYAQVDFADRSDALAFQEEITNLDFVVTAVGFNGPRLGHGYATSPQLTVEDDSVRAAFWQYAYQNGLPPGIAGQEPEVTTTVSASDATASQQEKWIADNTNPQALYDQALRGNESVLPPAISTALGGLLMSVSGSGRILVSSEATTDAGVRHEEAMYSDGSAIVDLSWQDWPAGVDPSVLYSDDATVAHRESYDLIVRNIPEDASATVSVFDGSTLARIYTWQVHDLTLVEIENMAIALFETVKAS